MSDLILATMNSTGPELVAALGLTNPPAGVLLLHGGAAAMSAHDLGSVRNLLEEGVVRAIANEDIVVLDGGTQAGITRIIGEGRSHTGATFPLVGVCPEVKVSWSGGAVDPGRHPLEPNHTHIILTPGEDWGDETPYLFALAAALAADAPSLAVLINGGEIALREVLTNVQQGREIVIVRGSGRLADQIAAARSGEAAPPDDELAAVVRDGHLTVVDIAEGPSRLVRLIRQNLGFGDRVETERRTS